jgi:glycosyltransferase involved in cell wall biosynthesis
VPDVPAVSVLLPVYDAAGHAADVVRRLARQTFPDLELVVVDDGSTDGTADELAAAIAGWPAARLIRFEQNRGVAAARRRLLAEARGEYLWFIDWDDRWSDRFLETMHAACVRAAADIAVCAADRVTPEGRSTGVIDAGPAGVVRGDAVYLTALLRGEVQGFLWNKLFRRDLWVTEHFPPLPAQEDMADQLLLAERVRAFVRVPETLYEYVQRPGSIINSVPRLDNLVACVQVADVVRPGSWGSPEAQRLYDWFFVWFGAIDGVHTALRSGARDPVTREVVAGLRRRLTAPRLRAAWRFSKARAVQAAAIRWCFPLYRVAYRTAQRVRAAVRAVRQPA